MQVPVPPFYHLYATERNMGHTGVFDPLVPLFAWFANSRTAVSRLRYQLNPTPNSNKAMVALSTAEFVTRISHTFFLDIEDFPDWSLLLDPFMLAPITLGDIRYSVADIPLRFRRKTATMNSG